MFQSFDEILYCQDFNSSDSVQNIAPLHILSLETEPSSSSVQKSSSKIITPRTMHFCLVKSSRDRIPIQNSEQVM